jgi:membrane fusion protein, multidrug efflux system
MTEERSVTRRSAGLSRVRLVWFGAGLAAVAAFAWLLASGRSRSAAATAHAEPAIQVESAAAARANVPVYLQGLGTVQAFYTVNVTSQVNGQLQKVAFEEGEHVKRGQLLAQIDPRPYQAALDLAVATHAKDLASLANAELDLKRYEVLAPQRLASKQTLDSQRALVAEDKAQVAEDAANIEAARTQLAYTQIRSPINGVTGIRLMDPGNIVLSTNTNGIVVVTQLQPIAVVFTLPETDLAAIQSAMQRGPVTAVAFSQDGKTQLDEGKITVIGNEINTTTGTLSLKAVFPNPHRTLWPGEFVNVRVLAREERNVVVIPSTAVQVGPNGPFTYVITAHSTVEPRPVTPGEQSGELTVIEKGLAPGVRVVTSNQFRLFAGARVSVY